jgi:hypothetical protein
MKDSYKDVEVLVTLNAAKHPPGKKEPVDLRQYPVAWINKRYYILYASKKK